MGSRSTALVTGASSGIGRAFAHRLAGRGYHLVLVARDAARLDTLATHLHDSCGVGVDVLPADLSDPAQLAAVEARLTRVGEPIDLLVNNAGFATAGDFVDLPLEREINEVQLNVVALVRLTHAGLTGMRARGRGGVINVSSIAGFQPTPGETVYAATKAFVTSFSLGLHHEMVGTGVVVSCLCPGFTRTEFHERANMATAHIPGMAWRSPDDVAAAGVAGFERGQALIVPGAINKAAVVGIRMVPGAIARRAARMVTRRH